MRLSCGGVYGTIVDDMSPKHAHNMTILNSGEHILCKLYRTYEKITKICFIVMNDFCVDFYSYLIIYKMKIYFILIQSFYKKL